MLPHTNSRGINESTFRALLRISRIYAARVCATLKANSEFLYYGERILTRYERLAQHQHLLRHSRRSKDACTPNSLNKPTNIQ